MKNIKVFIWKVPTFGMQIFLWQSVSVDAGTEEKNNIVVKNVSIIYISKQFRGFCVSHRKTRVHKK